MPLIETYELRNAADRLANQSVCYPEGCTLHVPFSQQVLREAKLIPEISNLFKDLEEMSAAVHDASNKLVEVISAKKLDMSNFWWIPAWKGGDDKWFQQVTKAVAKVEDEEIKTLSAKFVSLLKEFNDVYDDIMFLRERLGVINHLKASP